MMRRFLLLLLFVISLPAAAMAEESTWLLVRYGWLGVGVADVDLEKITMANMDQCELMGAKWMSAKRINHEAKDYVRNSKDLLFGYECLKGADSALKKADKAGTTWLVVRYGILDSSRTTVALEKIEMSNINQCELMGAKWMASKRIVRETKSYMKNTTVFGYECLTGA